MEKTISISALVVATAVGVGVLVKPDTSKMVAASASEDDRAVANVVQQSGVNQVQCCMDWVILDREKGAELKPVCSDTGYDPTRIAWLAKKLGAKGQCISFDPKELANGNVSVAVTVQEGTPRAKPAPIIAEAQAEEPTEP